MPELTTAELENEISQLLSHTNRNMADWYLKVRPHLRIKVLNQYDELRQEICKCMIFGLWQASINTTNHLLEKFMKTCIIEHEAGFKTIDSIESFDRLGEAFDKYDGQDLKITIDRACTVGIITKEEKKILVGFKDKFRNAYSHAESKKIFKDEPDISILLGQFKDDSKEAKAGTISAHKFLPMHGLMQKDMAMRDCFEYFEAVDSIIIKVEFEKFPELLEYNGLKWAE